MKKIFIYNLLKVLQILMGLIFQILLGRYFGVSIFADVYFISMTIFTFLSIFGGFFTEYFMQYYNDIRVHDHTEARRFYQGVMNFSLLVGISIFIVVVIFEGPIITVFAAGFDEKKIQILKSFFNILVFGLIWNRIITINNTLLNSEMRFALPYFIELLAPVFNIIFLLLFSKRYGINALAISALVSGVTGLLIQQIYISRFLKIRPAAIFWHKDFKKLIKNSCSLNIGNQIWSLKDPITTNILTQFPTGTVSIYFYAVKIISILNSITNSPIMQIFSSKVSRLVSEKDFFEIKKLLKETFVMNILLFLIILIPFAIMLPEILLFFFGKKFSSEEIRDIHHIFLVLIPFYLIISAEMPFTYITIAMKHTLKVIRIAVIFLIIYGVLVFSLIGVLKVYAIPLALMIAQLQNLIEYWLNVKHVFEENILNIHASIVD
jgi:putative peptidoglycan lipid II flippase